MTCKEVSRKPSRSTHWLSRGFEALFDGPSQPPEFDVIIVGSGYGAAITAHHLAGLCSPERPGVPLRIAVLERGLEYLEGMFPAELGQLPTQVRFKRDRQSPVQGQKEGLFDIRLGNDMGCLVANGLGGGSLINAGVMLPPSPDIFKQNWPNGLNANTLAPYLEACQALLQAAPLAKLPLKFEALRSLHKSAEAAPITVSEVNTDNLRACNHCGNCATGCNFGAKISLDVGLLENAMSRNAQMACYTGVTVQNFAACPDLDGGWQLQVEPTQDCLKPKYPKPGEVRCRRLIIAAGSLGSTELLMRSQQESGDRFSGKLGSGFSGNGDLLFVGYGQTQRVNGIAESPAGPTGAHPVGPTISGVIDRRAEEKMLVEEMAVPFPLKDLFAEVFATARTLHNLNKPDRTDHHPDDPDPFALDPTERRSTSIYAVMGDDEARGELVHPNGSDPNDEGSLIIEWKCARDHKPFQYQMQRLAAWTESSGLGGTLLSNPLWQALPPGMEYLTGGKRGPLFTVHPLGGCRMADSPEAGVVNQFGQVYIPDQPGEVYQNLAVLDGAIIPTSLGINPALTISAVAKRAIEHLSTEWGFSATHKQYGNPGPRPLFRQIVAAEPQPTELTVRERMVGDVTLNNRDLTLELTLHFAPASISSITGSGRKRLVTHPDKPALIRLFRPGVYQSIIDLDPGHRDIEQLLEDAAETIATATGVLELFPRVATGANTRTLKAGWAWLLNRGLRDLHDAWHEPGSGDRFNRLQQGLALASRAGEQRLMEYQLVIQTIRKGNLETATVRGAKTITYNRLGNPLQQMMDMTLSEFPGLNRHAPRTLHLDLNYLARIATPLIKLHAQQNTPEALMGLVQLGGYLTRMWLSIHSWTFRLPDAPIRSNEEPCRLPRPLNRLPNATFEQHELPLGSDRAVLSRYCREGGKPVVFFHGYSASGTTFAHDCLKPSIAEYLWALGFDVWIVDFRTSPALSSCTKPWTFEDIAFSDIPVALHKVCEATGKVPHVIAHCMGAAMLSMAILVNPESQLVKDSEGHPELLQQMPDMIDRLILSQVGPGVVFSPVNIFRAFLTQYLQHFLDLGKFSFRSDAASLNDQLIDRMLNLIPYPEAEKRLENPAWPPSAKTSFTAFRHRMDLLYGRDFSLGNVSKDFLAHIDEMFGPVNLQTLAQVIPFSRWKNITTRNGKNAFYLRANLKARWRFSTLSLHGRKNGLASVATLERNRHMFSDAGINYQTRLFPAYGHQDLWVSEKACEDVFPAIVSFLNDTESAGSGHTTAPRSKNHSAPALVTTPYLGPHIVSLAEGNLTVKFGKSPNLSCPIGLLAIPVQQTGKVYHSAVFDLEKPDWETHLLPLGPGDFDEHGMTTQSLPGFAAHPAILMLLVYEECNELTESAFNLGVGPGFHQEVEQVAGRSPLESIRLTIGLALAADSTTLQSGVIELPRTFDATHFQFAFGSCQFPAGPLDRELAFASYLKLASKIDQANPPISCLLLLGDQVYVDATAGLFDPVNLFDKYVQPHLSWLGNPAVKNVLRRLPCHMMLDDHEITNDFEACTGDAKAETAVAFSAFRSFQFYPEESRDLNGFYGAPGTTPVPTFLLNTRSDRDPRQTQDLSAGLVSTEQWQAFTTWLDRQPVDMPKIVTSASLLLPRRLAISTGSASPLSFDGWDGYPATLHQLLAYLADNQTRNLVFLSGDEHLPMVAEVSISRNSEIVCRFHSIHTGALYAPMPFANSVPADFMGNETFDVQTSAGTIRVAVKTMFYPPVDGFTRLELEKAQQGWMAKCHFDGSESVHQFNL